MAVVDRELRFIRVNEWLSAIPGKPVEALVGRKLEEFYPELAAQIMPWFRQAIDTQEPVLGVEIGVSTGRSAKSHQLVSFHPIEDDEGKTQQISIVVQDITAQKRLEEELRTTNEYLDTILLNLPVGVAILEGPDFRYYRINERLAEINGLSVEDHLDRPLAEILPDAAQDILPGLRRVLETGEPILGREFGTRLPKNPDRQRYFVDSFFPVKRANGRSNAVAAVVLDITARKEAEEALQRSHAELEQRVEERTAQLTHSIRERKKAEEAQQRLRDQLAHVLRTATMSELTAALAHEINQPLAAIRANAQAGQRFMSNDTPDLDEIGEILDDIVADNRRAVDVIRHMRGLMDKRDAHKLAVNVNEIIGEVTRLVRSDVVIKRVVVNLDLAEDLPEVCGDRIQLQQVCLNLILNSFDAMQGVPIEERRLVIQTSLQGNKAVCVSMEDTGVGFGGLNADQVFEPFQTTKEAGLGMGLAISRSIIEAHGGRIWGRANPDRGATFQFTVPLTAEDTTRKVSE